MMTSGNTTKHKLTLTTRTRGNPEVVDLACSCGWESTTYGDKTAVVKQTHIIEVLADRAGISVEW